MTWRNRGRGGSCRLWRSRCRVCRRFRFALARLVFRRSSVWRINMDDVVASLLFEPIQGRTYEKAVFGKSWEPQQRPRKFGWGGPRRGRRRGGQGCGVSEPPTHTATRGGAVFLARLPSRPVAQPAGGPP